MKKIILRRIAYSSLVGCLATAPFFVLEWIYSGGYPRGIPYAVFMALFVEATVFSYLVFSIFRTPYKTPVKEWVLTLLLRISSAILVLYAWIYFVADQMPCFLGGRGC